MEQVEGGQRREEHEGGDVAPAARQDDPLGSPSGRRRTDRSALGRGGGGGGPGGAWGSVAPGGALPRGGTVVGRLDAPGLPRGRTRGSGRWRVRVARGRSDRSAWRRRPRRRTLARVRDFDGMLPPWLAPAGLVRWNHTRSPPLVSARLLGALPTKSRGARLRRRHRRLPCPRKSVVTAGNRSVRVPSAKEARHDWPAQLEQQALWQLQGLWQDCGVSSCDEVAPRGDLPVSAEILSIRSTKKGLPLRFAIRDDVPVAL